MWMRTTRGVPDFQGVNVRVQGSNIRFTEYATLLERAFGAVGVNRSYVRSPHEYSNVLL